MVMIDHGPCPYLPDRHFRAQCILADLDAETYRELLDRRFRRNSTIFYSPRCVGCVACRPLRVPVAEFRPRRDQRRAWQRCRDLVFSWQPRGADAEREQLWQRYQVQVHADKDPLLVCVVSLFDAGIPGGELHARDRSGRLLAVSICDIVGDAWSSVYCYWEPEERRRGLGTVMAMAEIAEARARGLRWWYPGFWVEGCAKMAYKVRFQPAEILDDDGVWRPFSAWSARRSAPPASG